MSTTISRRALVAGTAGTAGTLLIGGIGANASADVDTVLEWYDVTAGAISSTTQVTNSRTWAIAWLASARAVSRVRQDREVALAGALHEALVSLEPARKDALDRALDATLARLAGERSPALEVGRREARELLEERAGDGLDPASVSPPYPTPPAKPGIWQPTPPAYGPALQAGTRHARAFLLPRSNYFRPGPPPALSSETYAKDLLEVKDVGSQLSAVRKKEQTELATFWYGGSLAIYTGALREALAQSGRSIVHRARIVAAFHVTSVDTQIATSDAKYAYLRWRPVTALESERWTPLHTTPSHPDYPSGHGTYAGAAEGVLTALVGRSIAPFALASPTAPGVTRTYRAWRDLTNDNVDARVYSGIHTRTADVVGASLGRRVAAFVLPRVFRRE